MRIMEKILYFSYNIEAIAIDIEEAKYISTLMVGDLMISLKTIVQCLNKYSRVLIHGSLRKYEFISECI